MILKSEQELKKYEEAAKISTAILAELVDMVSEGVYPIEIDSHAQKLCKKYGVRPAFKGQEDYYSMYEYSTCISVNDTVVHGVPSKTEMIKEGDIVKVDFGLIKDGLYTDHCHTVGLRKLTEENLKLINSGRQAIQEGVAQAILGKKVGDIGYAISSEVERFGYTIAKDFIGHAIGRKLWEEPGIPPIGKRDTGRPLTEGMVLCIEAQILAGSDKVYKSPDGWTIKTKDGGNAVMFEYMVVVKKDAPLVLTNTLNWKVVV